MKTPHDIGAEILAAGAGSSRAVAAGTGDATEVDGPWIDRLGFLSALAVVAGRTTLTEAATLSVAFNLQDAADDGSGAPDTGTIADFGTAHTAAVAATGGTGGSTEEVCVQERFNLAGAKRWIRVQHTPNLSAGATDTSTLAVVVVMGGANELPTQ